MTATAATTATLPIRGGWLIALLTALGALGQFASSAYLPSMPAMEVGLSASTASVQLTMTAYLAAFAVMQLVYGPLADRFGRRPVMIGGCALFVAGSLLCMTAASIEMVIVGRAVQAVGACAGLVASRAVTRDLFDGPALTRVMAAIAMAFSAVPAIAPIVGGITQEFIGWRATFGAAVAFGLMVMLPVVLYLRETNQHRMERFDLASIWQGYRAVAGHQQFRAFAFTNAAIMGGLFAFLTGSPAELVGEGPGKISALEYGIYPALTIPFFLLSGSLVRRGAATLGDAAMMKRGAWIALAGGVLMVLLPITFGTGVWQVVLPMCVFVGGMGYVFSVGHSGALRHFRERAGTASALMGLIQLGTAALFSAIVAALAEFGVLSFAIAMLVASVAAVGFSRGCR